MTAVERKHPDAWYCPATSKQTGGPCQKRAGWGTTHLGDGLCRFHGGAGRSGERHAEKAAAVRLAHEFGLPRDVEPHQALLEELHRSAGWVQWLQDTVVDLGSGELVKEHQSENGTFKSVSPYYELLADERKRLSEVAQACIKAGVEERRVRVIERSAEFAAQAIRDVLTRLGHRLDEPAVADAVRASLTVLDGGQAAA